MKLLNPETLAGGHTNELWPGGPVLPSVIDLTARMYDIKVDFIHAAPDHSRWCAIDMNTYDGSPEGVGGFMGYGASQKEARMALLVMFAEHDAAEYDRRRA